MSVELVLGTAGHIDHGKTALVRALTGVDTDRLPEEKARGITIELGFAPLALPSGRRLGVVDVPGHEALVRTMVAGASGIDLVLLVIAADEGVMPQTREHLAVCDLLGIRHGVVALTKCDAAEPDVAELAEAEARELVDATSLAGAPLLRVSARSGEGVDALREALDAAAERAAARTPRSGPARLWVDRVFEMRGFGTVATGTLTGSALQVGETLEIHPTGRQARIRGLQRFGEAGERAEPGGRCAVNLQGVARSELARGQLLATPETIAPTATADVEIVWLPDAPPLGPKPVSVEFLTGTVSLRANLAPIGAASVAPGTRGLARLHLEEGPLPLLPGDAFVVRGFSRVASGGATLGGGRVLDANPPHRRRSDPVLAAELESLAGDDPLAPLRVRVARAGYAGTSEASLRHETGLDATALDERIAALAQEGTLERAPDGTLLGREVVERLGARLLEALAHFHGAQPKQPGMPRGALRGALPDNVPRAAFELVLGRLVERGAVEAEGERVRRADHVARLSQREEAIAARLRADAMIAGLEPPTLRDQAKELGVDEKELRDLLSHLVREGSLVHAPGDFWFDRVAVDELRTRVVETLRRVGSLDTNAYKELIGTTRKWAVPLMELFDAEHLTVRRGEARVLRRGDA